MSGLLFTPLLGVPMHSALDICVAWAIMGIFMCKTFWPRPMLSSPHQASDTGSITGQKGLTLTLSLKPGNRAPRGSLVGLGLPSSRTRVDISVRRVWRTRACGAAKPWKISGVENFCRAPAETIETLAIFRPVTKILPTKRPPFWGPKTDPKMEATHSVSI